MGLFDKMFVIVHLANPNLVADDLHRLAALCLPLGKFSFHTTDVFFQHLCDNGKTQEMTKKK